MENIYHKNKVYYTSKRQYKNSLRIPLQCTEYRA